MTDRSFYLFTKSIRNSKTRSDYVYGLNVYKDYCHAETYSQLLYSIKEIEDKIIDFTIYLSEKGDSNSHINLCLSAIRRFYEMNDCDLRWSKIRRFINSTYKKKKDRPYTVEELQQLIKAANMREKVIITLCSSAGLRIGAVPSLKYGHLTPIEVEGMPIYKIAVYGDEDEEYTTFCSPECRRYIDEYLDYRKRYGEEITKDTILIREEFNRKSGEAIQQPRQLSIDLTRKIIQKLRRDTGIAKLGKDNDVHETHGFRKFFDTTLTKAGVNPFFVELLMGHKIGLKSHYFKPTETDLLMGNDKMLGYTAAINDLTINEENRLKEINKRLETKVDEINRMEEKHKLEVQALQQEMNDKMNSMQSQLSALISSLSNIQDKEQLNKTAKLFYEKGLIRG